MLIYLIFIFLAIAGLGIRLRGPRLIAFGLITVMRLSYSLRLIMFFFLVPIELFLRGPLQEGLGISRRNFQAGTLLEETKFLIGSWSFCRNAPLPSSRAASRLLLW